MSYGVTPTGFVKPSLTEIKASMEDAIRAAENFGASFDLTPQSPMGQLIGILAEREAEVWDGLQELYAAFTPDGATEVSLDNICGLTGTKRLAATNSTVTVTCTGTPATVIAAGKVFSVVGTGSKFQTLASATIGGGGTVSVKCAALETGPVIAAAGTLTVIDTPVAGLSSVTNALDAVLGSDVETDSHLRLRREAELRASGNAALESIRDGILALKDANDSLIARACTVFENETDVTDADGLPPHSIQCLVDCPSGTDKDNAVAAEIFKRKGAGIATYGGTSVNVTDSQAIVHAVKFDRPTGVNVYVIVNLSIDASKYPLDGDAEVKQAIVDYGNAVQLVGKDVVASAIAAQAFKVAGVLDAPPAFIGTAPSPAATTTIVITTRQIAKLDTSRIVVNTTPVTP